MPLSSTRKWLNHGSSLSRWRTIVSWKQKMKISKCGKRVHFRVLILFLQEQKQWLIMQLVLAIADLHTHYLHASVWKTPDLFAIKQILTLLDVAKSVFYGLFKIWGLGKWALLQLSCIQTRKKYFTSFFPSRPTLVNFKMVWSQVFRVKFNRSAEFQGSCLNSIWDTLQQLETC